MAEQLTTYLKRLKFDPVLMRSWVARYLANTRLVLLVVITIIIAGTTSYLNLPRNLNPSIDFPIVLVSTVLPGASPADIESLVSVPIEDAVQGLTNVKEVTSTSRESVSIVTIEFEEGIEGDAARDDVQSAVDAVDLPDDAQSPSIRKIDFENQPVWTFNLSSSGDSASLMNFSRNLRSELEDIASIDRVEIAGLESKEIQLVVKPEAITTYGMNLMQISGAIRSSLSSLPAGNVRTEGSNFTLSIDPQIIDMNDIRALKVSLGTPPNTNVVTLSDLASVSERSLPDQTESYIAFSGQTERRAVTFNVFRNKAVNIDKAVGDAEKLVEEKVEQTHGVFVVNSVLNTAELIVEQFRDLQRDFTFVVVLVFLILLVFLGLRQALVASLAIPLCFLITFVVMYVSGITLNFLSLFSLLLSLGLLVDDTIVVVSAMTTYWRSRKFTPIQTGLLVWKDFLIPILTTTITTVWAFVPLLLATGIIGAFIKPIPIVVSTTLIASIFVALFITLPFVIVLLTGNYPTRVKFLFRFLILAVIITVFYFLIPKNDILLLQVLAFLVFLFVTLQVREAFQNRIANFYTPRQRNDIKQRFGRYVEDGIISFNTITHAYKRAIAGILASRGSRFRILGMVIIFSLFSYLLVPLGYVKNEFFPRSEEESLYVSLELPQGVVIEKTKEEALSLLSQLKETNGVRYVTLDIGQAFSTTDGGISGGSSNQSLFTLVLPDKKQQEVTSIELAEQLRQQFAGYSEGKLQIIEISGGPPAGSDLQIKLFGPDLGSLNSYADKLIAYLETQEGVTNVDKSIKPGTSKIVFTPDSNKVAEMGIGNDQLGLFLRTFASGFTVDTIKLPGEEDEEQDITLRLSPKTQKVEDIYSLGMPTPAGVVPLASLGEFKLEPNPTVITREDSRRTISVTAGVRAGFNIPEKNQQLEQYADALGLPAGYGWETGGVNEENQASVNSILQAMILSFILIITTMVVQFNSFRKALIVMLVIPLSISGVFIIFALTNTPLSFPALIGVLALFGIVVKNAILVVDKIIENLKIGMDFNEAIADGSASRLEAITLTSVATIAGLIPITISDPLWRGLGGAIIAGLIFSGTIMLFFIPVVYYLMFVKSEGKVNVVRRKRAVIQSGRQRR